MNQERMRMKRGEYNEKKCNGGVMMNDKTSVDMKERKGRNMKISEVKKRSRLVRKLMKRGN